jgi:hypothetical protein
MTTSSTPPRGTVSVLLAVAKSGTTGCVQVVDAGEVRSGQLYLVDGALVAADVDGFRPRVGHRLRSGNLVTAEAFADALASCGGDVLSPRIGHELVERGHVSADVLSAVHREIILSAVGFMSTWVGTRGVFTPGVATSSITMEPVAVSDVLKALVKRRKRWKRLWDEIAAGLAVEECCPTPTAPSTEAAPSTMSAEAEALLAAMDGRRTVDQMAGECGFTRLEAVYLLHALVHAHHAEVVAPPGSVSSVPLAHLVAEPAVAPPVEAAPAPAHPAEPPTADVARATRAKALAALDRHLAAVDDVQAALGRMQQHATDTGIDLPRLTAAAGEVEHAHRQAAREAAVADAELGAAEEALVQAEAARARAGERAGAVRRVATELAERRDAVHLDLQRVQERADAIADEQQRLRAEADRLAILTTELQARVTGADVLLGVAPPDAG